MKQLLLICASFFFFVSCVRTKALNVDEAKIPDNAVLEIIIDLNADAYKFTNFGEPPQIAIWFENTRREQFKTVWVTHRAGKNDWKGKIECPVALSYWDSRKLFYNENRIDIVTGATPKNNLTISTGKPGPGKWNYFVEVNASADYNEAFSFWSDDNMPDSEANGQPSLVYKGQINFDSNEVQQATLDGRTKQFGKVTFLETDLGGITTAKNLIKNITTRFKKAVLESSR